MFLTRFVSVLRHLFDKETVEKHLDEEIEAFLQHAIDEKVRHGLTAEEARRQVLIEFGGGDQVKEQTRDARTAAWLDGIIMDVRYAIRTLAKRPSFALLAILTTALGIGAATSMFTVVDMVLLRPLPFRDSDRLVSIKAAFPGLRNETDPVMAHLWNGLDLTYSQYQALRQREGIFDEIAAMRRGTASLTGRTEPLRVEFARTTATLFAMLGVQPSRGRLFTVEDEALASSGTTILSYESWLRVFGADPNILGQVLLLDIGGGPTPYTIVGILPRNLEFASHGDEPSPTPDFWIPLRFHSEVEDSNDMNFEAFGLLRHSASTAEAELIIEQVFNAVPTAFAGFGREGARVIKRQELETEGIRASLFLLMGASGLLLMIACGNVANLLLGQAAARQHEIATRATLGASRFRITRQLVTESLLLSLAGGAIGGVLAKWGVRGLVEFAPAELPRMNEIGIDLRVFVFVTALSVIAGVLFGLAPTLTLFRRNLNESLKEGSRSQTGRHMRLPGMVIVGQIAFSFVLLVCAGLLTQSLFRLMAVDIGFSSENLLSVKLELPSSRYAKPAAVDAFYREALSNLRALPGVEALSVIDHVPFGGGSMGELEIEGQPRSADQPKLLVHHRAILPNYFSVIRAAITAGRPFTDAEDAGNAPVMIVNSTMARQFWPGESPINKRVRFNGRWCSIVGVSEDLKEISLRAEVPPTLYVPHARNRGNLAIIVRTSGAPVHLAPAVRKQIWSFDKDLSLDRIETLDSLVSRTAADERYRTILISFFAVASVSLALIGLYGVISRMVTYRSRELGIRIALGAQRRDVLTLILRNSIMLAAAGLAIGLVGAIGVTGILSSYLFQIGPVDGVTYAVIAFGLTAASLLAGYVPAIRATRIDPIRCFRVE